MEDNNTLESHMAKIVAEIKRKQEQVVSLNQEINNLVISLEETMRTMKNIQKTPENFVSRLATLPTINPIMTSTSNSVTISERIQYPKECIEAFEKINKFYDYKSNNTIVRSGKFSKYPRYISKEDANPSTIQSLLMYGFIDKIMVDESLASISKLPPLIPQSIQSMIDSYGPGIYGVQIFDATTDLTGKPIIICQIFKSGRNTIIEGDNTSLKTNMPCKIEQFHEWLCAKRAIGLLTLKSKLEDMMKGGKACVIGNWY